MLSQRIIPLLAILAPFINLTSAFPSRTHCVCSIADTSTTRYNPESLPTSEYTPKQPPNACTRLGPALENLHAANPDLYAEFLAHAQHRRTSTIDGATPVDEERPLSTTLLLHLSANSDLSALGVVLPSAPPAPASTAPLSIECKTHVERFPSVQDSLITLFVLKVIVYLAVLACVAECVTLALRWYLPRVAHVRPSLHLLTKTATLAPGFEHVPAQSALRLSGEEKRLMAVPEEAHAECPFSPGSDKKQRAYRSGEWTPRSGSGRKEFEAYVVEEDDDELSRPVM